MKSGCFQFIFPIQSGIFDTFAIWLHFPAKTVQITRNPNWTQFFSLLQYHIDLWWWNVGLLFTETNTSFSSLRWIHAPLWRQINRVRQSGVWPVSQVYYSKAAEALKELSKRLMHTCQYVSRCANKLLAPCSLLSPKLGIKSLTLCVWNDSMEAAFKDTNLVICTGRFSSFQAPFQLFVHQLVMLLCHARMHINTPMCKNKHDREIQTCKQEGNASWLTYFFSHQCSSSKFLFDSYTETGGWNPCISSANCTVWV